MPCMTVYKLVWDDFCSSYLEMIKPAYQQPIDPHTLKATHHFLENVLKALHPFMPFITEEIWHELRERPIKDCLIVAPWPKLGKVDPILLEKMDRVLTIVGNIRNIRNQKNISPNKAMALHVRTASAHYYEDFESIIRKLANLEEVTYSEATLENAISFVEGPDEFFVPMEGNIDLEAEKIRLQKELEYARGFFQSVDKRLSNERFVQGAPPIVLEKEYQKRADAEAKIKALEESLASLA